MIFLWIKGLIHNRIFRLTGVALGVAVTVTLFSSIGTFLIQSSSRMTMRALSEVPIDWQVQLSPAAHGALIESALKNTPSFLDFQKVGYADISGFSAETRGTVQTTGVGKVIGIGKNYRNIFPAAIRQLTGIQSGVLVAQQTAANLHVKEGDEVTVHRIGFPPVKLRIDGVVDLPYADSFFQTIGTHHGSAPAAPPDNVLLIPFTMWNNLFTTQDSAASGSLDLQYHVKLDHKNYPWDPSSAYIDAARLANNFQARTVGSALVGNNIAARLAAVRADASYAKVLFLFLGLPGVITALILIIFIAASGKEHLAREQALFRIRGAATRKILYYETMEAVLTSLGGIILGAVLTFVLNKGSIPILWFAVSVFLVGILTPGFFFLYLWRKVRATTVVSSRRTIFTGGKPIWQRLYLDFLFIGIAVFTFIRTMQKGYQVVLAPEGVPQISVHYIAFIAPFFLWIGGGLFAIRFWETGILNSKRLLTHLLNPFGRTLSGSIASTLGRQNRSVTRGTLLVTLAIAFAVSTAVFNTTFNAQAKVDAELTNGADVTVTGTMDAPAGAQLEKIRFLSGVSAAEPMMHRFAYVGTDLQDLYGIDPVKIAQVTKMSDAYFAGGDAEKTLALLRKYPDGVLVSEETKNDFQLQPGERLTLRLQFQDDHQYHDVAFRFIGVVREFPTAPTDSFLVANADYIAQATGNKNAEVVLINTEVAPEKLAGNLRSLLNGTPGLKITDLNSAQKIISSNLTSVDLHGLTKLELAFALLLVIGAAGIVFGLGLNERRRNFAILDALGAAGWQIAAFLWSEGLTVFIGGSLMGLGLGFGIAEILVKVLKGVFDPPPEHLFVPWGYLIVLLWAAGAATAVSVVIIKHLSTRKVIDEIRRL